MAQDSRQRLEVSQVAGEKKSSGVDGQKTQNDLHFDHASLPHSEPGVGVVGSSPVGNVKDLMKKFEPVIEPIDVCEAVDMLGIDSSGDDLVCDLAKMAAWIESDSPFPPSAPRDHVRRSKARRKALKKKYDAEDECRCGDPACATPEFGGFSTTESIPSPSLTAPSTSASASMSSSELGGAAATAPGPVPLRVVLQGSTLFSTAEDSCITRIVGGLGLGRTRPGASPHEMLPGHQLKLRPAHPIHRDTELLDIRMNEVRRLACHNLMKAAATATPSPSWRTTWTCPR